LPSIEIFSYEENWESTLGVSFVWISRALKNTVMKIKIGIYLQLDPHSFL